MSKRFLVTWGAGFIGSALVLHLVQDGLWWQRIRAGIYSGQRLGVLA
jgi:uncharacterized protein YbjT (DUF2867 family)